MFIKYKMGCLSESKKRQPNIYKNRQNLIYDDNYDIEETKNIFYTYIFEDNFQDFLEKKYNLNDPVFQLIRKDECEILTGFYKKKKDDFKNDMTSYLQEQNINFITMLTNQIIANEGGRNFFEQKIRDEVQDIYNNEDDSKINYLTIMILGITGTGKSCLVNNILYNGKEVAKEGYTQRVTKQRRIYSSKEVPYIRLVDTVGIELKEEFNPNTVGFQAKEFIQNQIKKNNVNDFVHCIWYCVNSTRFQEEEKKLVRKIVSTVESSKIPLIIVLTQSVDAGRVKVMTNDIKNEKFEDVIDIIAKEVPVRNGIFIPAYGLDKLIQLTLKKCKEALNMEMKKVMISNLKERIKNNIFIDNKSNKELIMYKMMSDIVKNDIGSQNFDDYINRIYSYYIIYFLHKEKMEKKSSLLIKQGDFNRHKNNFFLHCQEYENKIISAELPNFAYKFLDIQATKEKEKKLNVEIINKRNYKDFINTSGKFLMDNFNIFSSKFYLYFVITNIIEKLSSNFEQEFNRIVDELMAKKETENTIADCFYKKYSDFEQRVSQYSTFSKRGINYDVLPTFDLEKKPWMDIPTTNNKTF